MVTRNRKSSTGRRGTRSASKRSAATRRTSKTVRKSPAVKTVKSRAKSIKASRQKRHRDGTFAKGYVKSASAGKSPTKAKTAKSPRTSTRRSPRASKKSPIGSNRTYTPKMRYAESRFDFSDCSTANKKKVLEAVSESFTKEEISKIDSQGKVVVTDRSDLKAEIKGGYAHKEVNRSAPPTIVVKNNTEKATIVHELVHHERIVDDSRKRYATTAYPINGKGEMKTTTYRNHKDDITLAEETATIAETEIRTAQPSKGVNINWGKLESERKDIRDLDRKTMRRTENGESIPKGKAITGKKAVEMTDRNYPKTIVSNTSLSKPSTIVNEKVTGRARAITIFQSILNRRRKGKW